MAELAQHRRRFAGGTGKVVARARSDGRSVASGGGYVTAASSYIAYARALNRLGWTPAEFVVAESFAVRLRGMLGRRPIAAGGLPLVMAFPRCSSVHTCFMAYPIDIAFIDRSGNVLEHYENVCPWRMCSCPGAWAALERPSVIVSPAVLQRVPA